MATKHTCTIDVRCLKQHTCIGCGGQFSYLFARKVVGTADTPQGASVAAEASARQQIASDVDNHPCPTCGLYQPDMIGSRRLSAQRIMWFISIAAVAALFILSVSHVLQDDVFVPTALVVFGITGLIQLAIDARRPNRDLDSNRQKAQGLVDRGTLRLDAQGRPPQNFDEPWRPQKSLLPMAALVLFLAALAAIAAPKIMCELRGWPFNPNLYPGVVGPGDSTCFYMHQSISSVKGYFRGHVEAKARTADGKADIPLVASSNQSNWSDNISVKSSEKDNSSRLWVKIHFPDRPELADQQLDCQIRLNAEYPKIDAGGKSFHLEQQAFDDQLAVKLGPPHCGSDYRSLWWGATLGGMGLILVSGGLRVRRATQLKKQALPTAVYTLGEPAN